MSRLKLPVVPDGAARSVAAPGPGFAATTSTTEGDVDLSAYAGSYVRIQAQTEEHYITFQSATGGSANAGANALGADGKFAGEDTPAIIGASDYLDVVVPRGRPFLTYETVTGTGVIRVWKS